MLPIKKEEFSKEPIEILRDVLPSEEFKKVESFKRFSRACWELL